MYGLLLVWEKAEVTDGKSVTHSRIHCITLAYTQDTATVTVVVGGGEESRRQIVSKKFLICLCSKDPGQDQGQIYILGQDTKHICLRLSII